MNCREWEEKLVLYAGGDRAGCDSPSIDRHLAECAGCREFFQGMGETLDFALSAHQIPVSEAHFAAVRARVLTELAEPQRGRWRQKWLVACAAAVALLAALVFTRTKVAVRVQPPRPAPKMLAAAIPSPVAPLPAAKAPHVRRPRRLLASATPAPGPLPEAEPIVVKLMTNDPDVVIYWIGDK